MSTAQLADLLVRRGAIDQPTMQFALRAQQKQGRSLPHVLVELGLANEEHVLAGVAELSGLGVIDVGPGDVDPVAARLLTRSAARRLSALPVRFAEEGGLVVAMADPSEAVITEIAGITGQEVKAALARPSQLSQAIEHLAAPGGTDGSEANGNGNGRAHAPPAAPKPAQAPPAQVVERDPSLPLLEHEEQTILDLDAALTELVRRGGSDLHLTSGLPPMIRVHGELEPLRDLPKNTPRELRKALYAILTQKQREQFENEIELDLSYSIKNLARFRVNIFQQRDSIGSVMRLIPFEIKSLEDLKVPPQVANFAYAPRGLVLVTGPTGSGKSTTLAAVIDLINRERASHIMTVEDPIEFLHKHKKSVVNQRELGTDTLSFNAALKHVLRQDPDVILVGEMRDLETIQLAVTAAETGHLVFGTLHTQDAPQTIDRIIDVFPPHQQEQIRVMLAAALQGVVCQTLLKTTDGTGRVVACEVMVATSAIKNLIREGKTHQMYSSLQAGKQYGMVTMDQSLATLVQQGRVTYDAALEKCNNVPDFNRLCGRA